MLSLVRIAVVAGRAIVDCLMGGAGRGSCIHGVYDGWEMTKV